MSQLMEISKSSSCGNNGGSFAVMAAMVESPMVVLVNVSLRRLEHMGDLINAMTPSSSSCPQWPRSRDSRVNWAAANICAAGASTLQYARFKCLRFASFDVVESAVMSMSSQHERSRVVKAGKVFGPDNKCSTVCNKEDEKFNSTNVSKTGAVDMNWVMVLNVDDVA